MITQGDTTTTPTPGGARGIRAAGQRAEAVRLHAEGLTQTQTAERMGINQGTVGAL